MDECERIRALLADKPGGLTIEEISRSLSISRITATKYLNALLSGGQAQKRICGPARVFTLAKRIPISRSVGILFHPALLVDQELFIRQVNDPFTSFFSVDKDDLQDIRIDQSPLMGSFPPELPGTIEQVILNGKEFQSEEPIKVGNRVFFLRLRYIPVGFETGDTGVVLIFEDITELKEYQERLLSLVQERTEDLERANEQLVLEIAEQKRLKRVIHENEKLYSTLIENANVIILELDVRGRIRFCNDYALSHMGYSFEELRGRPFLGTIIPEGSPHSVFFRSAFDSFATEGPSAETIQTEIASHGTIAWIKWTIRSIRKGRSKKKDILVVGTDITQDVESALKTQESERLMAAVIAHLPDPTFVIDRERRIIFWNRAMETMTGIKSQDIIGKGRETYPKIIYEYHRPVLADLIFEPDNPEILSHFTNIRKENGAIVAETLARKPSGTLNRYWVKVTPLIDTKNEIIGAIQSLRDITEYPFSR
jgi:PAS domain S-box-containing protein